MKPFSPRSVLGPKEDSLANTFLVQNRGAWWAGIHVKRYSYRTAEEGVFDSTSAGRATSG